MAIYQLLFRNWKQALLWAIGVSASVGAFFAEGGRHEQLEANVEKIREQRSHTAPPAPAAEPAAAQASPSPSAAANEDEGAGEVQGPDGENEAEEDAGWAKPQA